MLTDMSTQPRKFYSFDTVQRIVKEALEPMNPRERVGATRLLIAICEEQQIVAAKQAGWKMQCDGPPDYGMFGLHPLQHQPDDDPIPMREILNSIKK